VPDPDTGVVFSPSDDIAKVAGDLMTIRASLIQLVIPDDPLQCGLDTVKALYAQITNITAYASWRRIECIDILRKWRCSKRALDSEVQGRRADAKSTPEYAEKKNADQRDQYVYAMVDYEYVADYEELAQVIDACTDFLEQSRVIHTILDSHRDALVRQMSVIDLQVRLGHIQPVQPSN
jgi:hypothetical protein